MDEKKMETITFWGIGGLGCPENRGTEGWIGSYKDMVVDPISCSQNHHCEK